MFADYACRSVCLSPPPLFSLSHSLSLSLSLASLTHLLAALVVDVLYCASLQVQATMGVHMAVPPMPS